MRKNHIFHLFFLLLYVVFPLHSQSFTILYTADEHGWFESNVYGDGAAAMMQLWKEKEQYTLTADSFLVLSGGDMWTGASASTFFRGQSMFQVMQAMGYDAAALGNHEFDFSLDTLQARAQRSSFPFLAANISANKGEDPCFAQPWMVKIINGVRVGILGLAQIETPHLVRPETLQGLSFHSYAQSIKKYVQIINAAGADVVLILGHICQDEMEALVPVVKEMGIPLMMGGHCHQYLYEECDGVHLVESEPFWQSYIKMELEYDPLTKKTTLVSQELVEVKSASKDRELHVLLTSWADVAKDSLKERIGYSQKGILRRSKAMEQLVLKAWMKSIPEANIVVTNAGSLRQSLAPGPVVVGDILGLMPFENELIKISVKGRDINEFMQRIPHLNEDYIWRGLSPNMKFEENKTYQLITTDYLYHLDETLFKHYDMQPGLCGVNYRDPVLDFLREMQSHEAAPLERFLK